MTVVMFFGKKYAWLYDEQGRLYLTNVDHKSRRGRKVLADIGPPIPTFSHWTPKCYPRDYSVVSEDSVYNKVYRMCDKYLKTNGKDICVSKSGNLSKSITQRSVKKKNKQ